MLMDEPFAAVDPIVRARLQDQFLDIQDRLRKTIVFVTHDIDEAIKLADRIAILNVGGVLEQFASPEEILPRAGQRFRGASSSAPSAASSAWRSSGLRHRGRGGPGRRARGAREEARRMIASVPVRLDERRRGGRAAGVDRPRGAWTGTHGRGRPLLRSTRT